MEFESKNNKITILALHLGYGGVEQYLSSLCKMLENDYTPGFFLKHFIKDMKLANEEAIKKELSLDILKETLENYKDLEKDGMGDLGTQALIKHYMK